MHSTFISVFGLHQPQIKKSVSLAAKCYICLLLLTSLSVFWCWQVAHGENCDENEPKQQSRVVKPKHRVVKPKQDTKAPCRAQGDAELGDNSQWVHHNVGPLSHYTKSFDT